jgi:hypothetical protein
MRFVSLLLCCALVLFGVAGCSNLEQTKVSDDESVLLITTHYWSGWGEDYESDDKQYKYDLVLGAEYDCPPDSEGFPFLQFKIVDIKDGSVAIKTTHSMSEQGKNNTLDLDADQTEFTIVEGEVLTLATPSLDAGVIYTLELHPLR